MSPQLRETLKKRNRQIVCFIVRNVFTDARSFINQAYQHKSFKTKLQSLQGGG